MSAGDGVVRGAVALCLLVVAVCGGASEVSAQAVTIAVTDDRGDGVVTLRAWPQVGSERGVGLGFLRVELQNLDGAAHDVVVRMLTPPYGITRMEVSESLRLDGDRAVLFLAIPSPSYGGRVVLEVDGRDRWSHLGLTRAGNLTGIVVTDYEAALPIAQAIVQGLVTREPATPALSVWAPGDLPVDWRLFTCLDFVLVDGRALLSGQLQDAVARYASVGGTVLVADAPALAPGRLRQLAVAAAADDDVAVACGRGRIAALPSLATDVALGVRRARRLRDGAPVVARELFEQQAIAGLGKAPVGVFLVVILGFAIVVGPVNFVLLRRRRRPLLALLTVPLIGFGTTVGIIAFGLLHDGLGVRGAVTSWTVLDQPRHELSLLSARTLFAGTAPASLPVAPESLLLSSIPLRRDEGSDVWSWDAGRGELEGGVLPSRTVTPLVTLQVGPMRRRLTLRQVDQGLELVSSDGIEIQGELLVRDLDGGYWLGIDVAGSGVLRALDEREGAARFARRLVESATWRGTDGYQERDVALTPPLLGWGAPGSYVCRVRRADWLDSHGLDVDYDDQRHFLFGRLGPEDFVR